MTVNLILALGIMIVTGFFGGALAAAVKFPRVTGYLIVGILLSPSLFNIIPKGATEELSIVIPITLGILGYQIGGSLRLESLKSVIKSVVWVASLQSLMPWFLTVLVITFLAPLVVDIPNATLANTYFPIAFILGAIACSSAPVAIMAIVRECNAKGPLTTMVLAVLALTDVITVFAFSLALNVAEPLVRGHNSFSAYQILAVPVIHVLTSIALGITFAFGLIFIARLIKTKSLLLAAILGTVVLCIGVTEILDASGILATMVLGFVVAHKAKRQEMFMVIENIEDLVFTIFFVLNGMHLDLRVVKAAGVLSLLIILCRITGKYFGTFIGAKISGTSDEIRKYAGLVLLPKAGLTLGLAFIVESTFSSFGSLVFNALLASTVINLLVTPPLAKYAIVKVGEQNAKC